MLELGVIGGLIMLCVIVAGIGQHLDKKILEEEKKRSTCKGVGSAEFNEWEKSHKRLSEVSAKEWDSVRRHK